MTTCIQKFKKSEVIYTSYITHEYIKVRNLSADLNRTERRDGRQEEVTGDVSVGKDGRGLKMNQEKNQKYEAAGRAFFSQQSSVFELL